jgi:proline dehydrogenase
VLRRVLLSASTNETAKRLVAGLPVSRDVVARFVAGETVEDAARVTRQLLDEGLSVSLDHLGEDTLDTGRAAAMTRAYVTLLARLADSGLADCAEVSVKLSAIGRALPGDGDKIAYEHAHEICAAAAAAGTTVTLDMEDHTTTDSTLAVLRDLRVEFPWVGAVLQSYLRRTEADCRDLAYEGSRVRLCKGAYKEPASVAYQSAADVDAAYVRCLKLLISGPGYPMIATHDPRLVAIAESFARQYGRAKGSYEFQMLYGVRPGEQRRLAALGEKVRVYVPYGVDWYGYFLRRLAERPANVGFFLRALVTTS